MATHLANHAAGLISLEGAESARLVFLAFWRSTPGTVLLYTAFVTHITLAFVALYERHTLRMPAPELARLILGFNIPFLLIGHFVGTRLGYELYGHDDPYARIVWGLWSNDRGLSQLLLMIDLRRWTGLAEKHLPHDLVYVRDQYFNAVGDAVREAGGVPNQFIGDGVMAIFGVDTELSQASRQAIAAARGIEERMRGVNEKLQREFGHTFGFGIGIHAGPAAVGEVGYRETRTLSAVGDTVNTASRLQDLTKQYEVPLVISERVALAADLRVSTFASHEIAVRGRANPLTVYAIASIADLGA